MRSYTHGTAGRNSGSLAKGALILIFFGMTLASAAAQVATIDYLQGWVDIKYPNGETVEAMIGDSLNKDDTIITGDDGTAVLTRPGAAEITVNRNSVFSIREIDSGGEKETVMHTALGSVKFKFLKLFGKEPKISTPSSVAGVRGTEFTVFAGDEGSALFTVDSGEVQVTSQGIPVTLYQGEGVEVKAGRPPGEKFELKGRPLDYSSWSKEKQSEFSADPIAGLKGIEKQMDDYIREVKNLQYAYDDNHTLFEDLQKQFNDIKEKQGEDAARAFLKEKVAPVGHQESIIFSNLRYFALTAFSLKQYVMAPQYSLAKAKILLNEDTGTYQEFLDIYDRIKTKLKDGITPILVPNDI